MTLTELRYIVILSEEQHFGRTAERCHVSQPTLSIAVRKLEEELGVELFERTKTRVVPTVLGEKIVSQARELLTNTAVIKSLADAGKDQLNSPLALGAIFTMGPYLLPQLIPHLKKQAPNMPLYVQEDYTASLRKKLRDGDLDIILVSLPFSESDVVTQELFEEPLVVVMPQAHPLARKAEIKPADIARADLLLPGEGHCLRAQVLALHPEWQQANDGQQMRYAAEGNSLETLRYMVAAGLGLSILPRSAAEANLCAAHRLVTRPLAGGSRKLALAWRASFPRHKAVDVLRKAIQTSSGAYWNFTTEPDAVEQTMLPIQRW
ncbi:MAG TPA: hydrogen peroxide-inducible genes activator [Cellvibrio sp.]|nr:hydrogen peroxide-inducible genes activator [Cellvibrio sp.]